MATTSSKRSTLVPLERVERTIRVIRGQRVILDEALAQLYGVPTKRLNEQVKRNHDRFPEDFMFQLSPGEWESLRSQIATSKPGRGGRRTPPFVFTEHGAVMAANVLNSPTAAQASILVVSRAFVRLRQLLSSHEALARKLEALEKKYDGCFKAVFDTIQALMAPPQSKRRRIGFTAEKD